MRTATSAFGSFDVYVVEAREPDRHVVGADEPRRNVNTAGSETRSTISWDRFRLYFGRDGEIYSSSRARWRDRD